MDVTPVGTAEGIRWTRGWVRIVLGALTAAIGTAALAAGIVHTVQEGSRARDEAVARGTVGGPPVTVPAGDHTVWLDLDTNDEHERDLTVRDTACAAGDLDDVDFRGARQGSSVTIGDLSTVGTFTAPARGTTMRCAYTAGTRRSQRQRFAAPAFLVAPGRPSGATTGVLVIVGGAFALVAGILLIAWGAGRRARR